MDIKLGAATGHAGVQTSKASPLPSRVDAHAATSSAVKPGDSATVSASNLTKQPSQAALQEAVDQANKALANKASNELQFAVEAGAGIAVVKLIDVKTGDAIMQFPSQAMLEIAKTIDQVTGAIIKHLA